jgi:hypothetical protein
VTCKAFTVAVNWFIGPIFSLRSAKSRKAVFTCKYSANWELIVVYLFLHIPIQSQNASDGIKCSVSLKNDHTS